MTGAGRLSRRRTGSLAAMAMVGVSWYLPPKGISTAGCADGGVEALAQALLAANVEVTDHRLAFFLQSSRRSIWGCHDMAWARMCASAWLLGAVGVQKLAGQVDNGRAVPYASRSRFSSVTVATMVASRFSSAAYAINASRHPRQPRTTAMRSWTLGNCQLGAVQALILAGDFVQVNMQTVSQFADGDRHAARAEVVAALDEAAGILAIAEQALQFALNRARCPSAPPRRRFPGLVSLCALEEPVAPPHAVAARAAAQQDDHITGGGLLTAHMSGGRCAARPRQSPCAWRRSRGGTARLPDRWPGQSGCRRSWNSRRQRW